MVFLAEELAEEQADHLAVADHVAGFLQAPRLGGVEQGADDHGLARQPARLGDEVADHGQGDVGLQQGQAHLAQGLVDVLFRKDAPAGEPVEDTGKSLAEAVEHEVRGSLSSKRNSPPWTITSTGGLAVLVLP